MDRCTPERFMRDVANHELTVVRDDDTHRHLLFRKPGCSAYAFQIITWPGELCITGDMGTYVFSRLRDMFAFFRVKRPDSDPLDINPSYWGEKLVSIARHERFKEWDREAFVKDVVSAFRRDLRHRIVDWRDAFRNLRDTVLCCENEHEAARAVNDFEAEGKCFQDGWELADHHKFTFHYLWCCYAIVWAIQQYDATKTAKVTP